ncbi:hypothetical protein EG68_04122 [Paragonimus skrjabini miyazakii]|uniref:Uncharacterized protein n=1 Tax=Paragonimus skrjabini miyazakii TaxID=59628 RepID=A0A8S9YZG5_9TREM|nr:hypothetical protein EG68_04122 [Paragonimus skrjabini miyazakii]
MASGQSVAQHPRSLPSTRLDTRHESSNTHGRQWSHHAAIRVGPRNNLVEIVCHKGLARGNSCEISRIVSPVDDRILCGDPCQVS